MFPPPTLITTYNLLVINILQKYYFVTSAFSFQFFTSQYKFNNKVYIFRNPNEATLSNLFYFIADNYRSHNKFRSHKIKKRQKQTV